MKQFLYIVFLCLSVSALTPRGLFLWGSQEVSTITPDIRNKEKQKDPLDAQNLFGFFGQPSEGNNAADQVGTLAKLGQQMGYIDKDSSISKAAEGTQKAFGNAPPAPKKSGVGVIDTFNDYTQQLGTYTDSASMAD